METDLNKTYDDEYFVGRDVFGYPYNMKYPPDYQKYGSQFSGYATPNQEFFSMIMPCLGMMDVSLIKEQIITS